MLSDSKMTANEELRFEGVSLCSRIKRLTPYILHLGMCLAVTAYVFLGAYTIRELEATQTGFTTKAERILENTGRTRYSEQRSSETEPAVQRVKRVFSSTKGPLQRSRRCVQGILSSMAKISCQQNEKLNDQLFDELDACYKDDLLDRVRRFTYEEKQNKTEKSIEPVGEWRYWEMKDSILFCFTVLSTIGYGNVAPQTTKGQAFVIAYGLIGVPFSLLVIANLGKFLAEVLKTVNRRLSRCFRSCFCRKKQHPSKKALLTPVDENGNELESDNDQSTPFGLFIAFILYILIGSMVISIYEEDMTFFKAVYFNFVSLTTIGLGDVVPTNSQFLGFTLIYIAIGLALTTIAIEIASDYLKKLHYFGRSLEDVGQVAIWFGGKKLTMRQLVKNLGDQFNLPVSEVETLNLDQFVESAVKVENGEIPTLRDPNKTRPIYITDFKNPFRQGRVLWVDEDEASSGIQESGIYSSDSGSVQ
ncbi:TWiK family of potassium channels protein 9 [Aphelenchoides besseyi]|nr:TWiK family of potassium channels protein 9 [Aphelenchoides besseyi]KAI6194466.1 TWiK family of potassium channels protein 9 [Aphelenchoides besseyi]